MLHGISPPWWNSLESVQKVHGRLELLAIFLFGLLVLLDILEHGAKEPRATFLKKCALAAFALAVLAELMAYPYSRRSDTLSNNQIRNDEQTISKLSKDVSAASQHATDAAGAAARAKDSALRASDLARIAHQEADSFEKDIVSAKRQAVEAESHLVEALREAAAARREAAQAAAELAKYRAPRWLTEPQAQEIIDKVRPFGPQLFEIIPYWDAKESLGIAQRIADILTRPVPGWKLEQPKSATMLLGGIVGVQVWMHPAADEDTRQAADALVSALNAAGIETILKVQNAKNNPKNDKIVLNVGTKQ